MADQLKVSTSTEMPIEGGSYVVTIQNLEGEDFKELIAYFQHNYQSIGQLPNKGEDIKIHDWLKVHVTQVQEFEQGRKLMLSLKTIGRP